MTNWFNLSEEILYGTEYGGWTLPSKIFDQFHSLTVLSCGVGEDISFDNQILLHSDWDIVLIDPTPRAKVHYLVFLESIKRNKELRINNSDEIYTYTNESKSWPTRLQYIEKALVSHEFEGESLTMHEPRFSTSVSHSAENRLLTDVGFIADSITMPQLFEAHLQEKPWGIKLDIEGSEWGVVRDIIDLHLKGYQLPIFACIEVHKLSSTKDYKADIQGLINSLSGVGLQLYKEKGDDLTFINSNILQ